MLWGLSLTLLCKDNVSAVVDWCCWAGGAGEPWLLENTQETKQGKYITAYCQIIYTQKSYFKCIVKVKPHILKMSKQILPSYGLYLCISI